MQLYKATLKKASSLVLGGADIQEVVDCVHLLLENPIIVQDNAMRVAGCTTKDAVDDEMQNLLRMGSAISPDSDVASAHRQFFDELDINQRIAYCTPFKGFKLHAARTKEIAGGCLYVFLVQKNRRLTDGDLSILVFFTELVGFSLKINVEHSEEAVGFSGLFIDALEQRIDSGREFRHRMKAMGLEVKRYSRVIVAAPFKGRLSDRQAQRYLADTTNTFPFGKGVCYQGTLVFFVSHDTRGQITDSDFAHFASFLKKCRMVAAVSELREGDPDVHELYQSALFSMDVGRKVYPEDNLYSFERCQKYWPYEVCLRESDADHYRHPALDALRDIDLKTGSSLLLVLDRLAMNRGNRSKTAKDLYMQRNTLQSRIKEIELLCRLNLSDPLEIDHIRRSLVLEKYRVAPHLLSEGKGEA